MPPGTRGRASEAPAVPGVSWKPVETPSDAELKLPLQKASGGPGPIEDISTGWGEPKAKDSTLSNMFGTGW